VAAAAVRVTMGAANAKMRAISINWTMNIGVSILLDEVRHET